MPKPRTKRQQVREERKAKRRDRAEEDATNHRDAKRQRKEEEAQDPDNAEEDENDKPRGNGAVREFFGMLEDQEQEYFRHADELLELNQFPSSEERDFFLQNVYKEAQGKELKLASSQSCSRLMERLILLSNTQQKKHLFEAFASHFLTLVQHRFASHCCEMLFAQSAPVVGQELGGFMVDTTGDTNVEDAKPENSMENLFLLTLDEFEDNLGYLLTDRYASHTLRVLLIVLSGRPLEDSATKSMLRSKKKEYTSVSGQATKSADVGTQLRPVPSSFTMAARKIISDATSSMDFTALRVLAKHPTGNPLLQLLLELDISMNQNQKSETPSESNPETLLYRLLPGAPSSLNDGDSQASDFVNSMVYDQIGSRLLETLITHSPGKIFKALQLNFFGPRIATYVRNDIASYAAIRALNRFSKEDLADAVNKIIPIIPMLVTRARFNVIKTLYERCEVREAFDEIKAVTKALTGAFGSNPKDLVPKLCYLVEDEPAGKEEPQQLMQNKSAMASHGAQLVTTMLSIPGAPSKVAQKSLLALPADLLVRLATQSMQTVTILTKALSISSKDEIFHKSLVASLAPQISELAISQFGHNLVNAIVSMPSRGVERSIPFHIKQSIMGQLSEHESELRDSWMGRSVWRTWRGDLWKTRRADWVKWAKEFDGPGEGAKPKPWERQKKKEFLKKST